MARFIGGYKLSIGGQTLTNDQVQISLPPQLPPLGGAADHLRWNKCDRPAGLQLPFAFFLSGRDW